MLHKNALLQECAVLMLQCAVGSESWHAVVSGRPAGLFLFGRLGIRPALLPLCVAVFVTSRHSAMLLAAVLCSV